MRDYQLRQRDYLLEISRAMTSRLDLASVLRLIIKSSVEMLRGQAGLIALRQSGGELSVRASYGLPPELVPFFSPLLTDIPHLSTRWQIPDLHFRLSLVAAAANISLSQVVALPLSIEGELIGVIYVFRTIGGAFSANDVEVLASFANQAAIAVRNARLYEKLWAEERRLAAIIDNSADGVMILDPECRITAFNRALSRITGWLPQEAIGRPCQEVLSLHNRQGVNLCETGCPLNKLSPEEKFHIEGEVRHRNGRSFTVVITYTPLFDVEGNLQDIIANVNDITRFREAEEMKSMFISAVSHELKTPVALIKGYADTLRREDARWDEETLREGLNIIVEESDRLDTLINNLLEASRIQAGGLKLEFSYVNLQKLAEKVVSGFRMQTKEHDLRLDFPPELPPVPADEERLRQVLSNLINNAIKYSPKGGTIWVGAHVHKDWLTVYVADQGVGIPLEEQERIFEPFYRGKGEMSQNAAGAGLGLYLCRAIVEAHGGRIWVESQPGKGSIFAFTLPLRRHEEKEI